MKYIVLTLSFTLFFFSVSNAQEVDTLQDTSIVTAPLLDSAYFQKNIFSILESIGPRSNRINIEQSASVRDAFDKHIALSSNKKISGYRVRIFFDNKQDSRARSLGIKSSFTADHPDIHAYWTYDNPYFRVTVGDFRTKSEALMFMNQIKPDYPSAFLIKETINFPPL